MWIACIARISIVRHFSTNLFNLIGFSIKVLSIPSMKDELSNFGLNAEIEMASIWLMQTVHECRARPSSF